MKKKLHLSVALIVFCMLVMSACSHTTTVVIVPKKAPPGQVKKETGSKSAKTYAPGQQKKKH